MYDRQKSRVQGSSSMHKENSKNFGEKKNSEKESKNISSQIKCRKAFKIADKNTLFTHSNCDWFSPNLLPYISETVEIVVP